MNKLKIQQKFGSVYLLICMLVFCFFVYSKQADESKIDVPHIVTNIIPLYIVIAVTLCFCVGFLFAKSIRIDVICFILIARIILHCVPIAYTTISDEFDVNIATSVLALFAYLMGRNFAYDKNFVNKIIKIIFVLVCTLTILESFLSGIALGDGFYNYKHNLVLPIGGSNAIIPKIVPLYALFIISEKSKRNYIFYTMLLLVSVILTNSRSGMIIMAMALCLTIVWRRRINLKTTVKLGVGVVVAGILLIIFIFGTNLGAKVFSLSWGSVFSRLELWKQGLELFMEYPLFGGGFSESAVSVNPHNVLISVLIRSGIVGIILFLSVFFTIAKKIKKYSDDPYIRGGLCFLLCILLQSMVEIVIFNYINDIIIWFVIGTIMATYRNNDVTKSV